MNSVFTSFYFVGFLIANLSGSLPNYESKYPPLGPTIIKDLMIGAVGQDVFKENLTANLEALQILALTIDRLSSPRIRSSIFPGGI